jgi:hypothetical protein
VSPAAAAFFVRAFSETLPVAYHSNSFVMIGARAVDPAQSVA